MTQNFDRDEWWAAENAARSRELEHSETAMSQEFEQLRDRIAEVFKDSSVATRITVLAHLMVESAALPTILPGNVLEQADFNSSVGMLRHCLNVMARRVIPQKLASQYGVRMMIQVRTHTSEN